MPARSSTPSRARFTALFSSRSAAAFYGGLWAQILDNPSFEDNFWSAGRIRTMLTDHPELVQSSNIGLPLPWEPLVAAQGWRYEPRWGDAANSTRSLLIMALP